MPTTAQHIVKSYDEELKRLTNAIVEMGGHDVTTERQSRVSEAAVRGFWQQWRGLMGY